MSSVAAESPVVAEPVRVTELVAMARSQGYLSKDGAVMSLEKLKQMANNRRLGLGTSIRALEQHGVKFDASVVVNGKKKHRHPSQGRPVDYRRQQEELQEMYG